MQMTEEIAESRGYHLDLIRHCYWVVSDIGFVGAFTSLELAAEVCVTRQNRSHGDNALIQTREGSVVIRKKVRHWVEYKRVIYNYAECLEIAPVRK